MNKLGVHALVWAGDLDNASITRATEMTRKAGFDLLEFSLHDTTNLDIEHARQALEAHGLGVTCSRGLAFDADVSHEDLKIVAKGERLLHDSLEVASALGSIYLCGALYSALGKYSQPVTKKGRQNAVSILKELAKSAREKNLSLGIEICNRYETNVINTARDALQFTDEIGEGNVFIHLDTYHMNIEESSMVQPVLECRDRLGYVHIGENHRGYLGSGSIDFTTFFQALMSIDYQGPITFESFSSEVVMEGLSSDLAIWRNLWSDGLDLATQANQFMRAHLAAARKS